MKMNEIDTILHRLQENEEITKKFQAVETKILSILEFKDLFEMLLSEIMNTFEIPYVWISMVRNSEISTLIESLGESDNLKEHINLIDKESFMALLHNKTTPILENENLKPYFKLLPINKKFFIKSIAVAPLSIDGEIIGSMNQADSSSSRFKPGMDTSLLKQLALKVSLCLSNVTAHEKLKFLAYHDPLTGLLNRRVLENILDREFHRAMRYEKVLSLAFIDLDDLKMINDSHGHITGDTLLKHVAETLLNMTRQSDAVARYESDKFVIILPETEAGKAKYLLNRMKSHFNAHPFIYGAVEIPVRFSFGISSTKDTLTESPEQLLSKADKNLCRKKKARKTPENKETKKRKTGKVITLPDINGEKEKKGL